MHETAPDLLILPTGVPIIACAKPEANVHRLQQGASRSRSCSLTPDLAMLAPAHNAELSPLTRRNRVIFGFIDDNPV